MNAGSQGPFSLSPDTCQVKLHFEGEDEGLGAAGTAPMAGSSRDGSDGLSHHFIPIRKCCSSSLCAGTAMVGSGCPDTPGFEE